MARNKEFERWAAKNLDDVEKRRWFQAAIEIDEIYAGQDRRCPKCGNVFRSRFNRGKCTECGHMFFASNPQCGSNEWLRVPELSLFAEPIVHGSYLTKFYSLDQASLPTDPQAVAKLVRKEKEDIQSINEFLDESNTTCEQCIEQLLTGGSAGNVERAMYVYAFEIICSAFGHQIEPQVDFHDIRSLPLATKFAADALPFGISDSDELPALLTLPADHIPAERDALSNCEPRMPGSVRESEYLKEQIAAYTAVLARAAQLGNDLYAFRY